MIPAPHDGALEAAVLQRPTHDRKVRGALGQAGARGVDAKQVQLRFRVRFQPPVLKGGCESAECRPGVADTQFDVARGRFLYQVVDLGQHAPGVRHDA